jgi:steroid delta-isomerase-like uncharacterized protein
MHVPEVVMSDCRRDPFSMFRTSQLSRRTTLKVGGIGLAAAAGMRGLSVGARENELPEVIAAFVAAWESLDADQIAGIYAEDAVAEDVPAGTVTRGREEIRRHHADFIDAYSDASSNVPTVFATEDRAAFEWVFEGNYTGMLSGLPQGTGQPVTIRGVTLVEFADDLVQRTVEYFDIHGILVQLGAVPPPGTPGATPSG